MKKLLLSLLAGAVAASAMAWSVEQKPLKRLEMSPNFITKEITAVKPVENLSRATETSVYYTPSGDPYQVLALQSQVAGMTLAQAMEFTSEKATEFAGNTITQFAAFTGCNETQTDNNVKSGKLFITYDLEEEPVYTQNFKIDVKKLSQFVVTLDTPFTIEAGKAFFIGFEYVIPEAKDMTFVVDYLNHSTDEAGWIGLRKTTDTKTTWTNITGEAGFLCLGVVVTGTNFPENTVHAVLADVQPVVEVGKPFDLAFQMYNAGVNGVENIDIIVEIGNQAPMGGKLSFRSPLPYENYGLASLTDIICSEVNHATPIKVTIDKVNGVANLSENNTLTLVVDAIAEGTGFKRNVVLEEFTGTWCGFCPRGIEVCEYIRSEYDGDFFPVGIHVGDAMEAITYKNVANKFNPGGSAPLGLLNRAWISENVTVDEVVSLYDYISEIPAIAKVDFVYTVTDGVASIDATTVFSYDIAKASDTYVLSFGVTEDEVGPYTQTNYYSEEFQMSKYGELVLENLPGWSDQAYEVDVKYNDVARQLNSWRGLANSIPADVKAGEAYPFHYDLKLNKSIKDTSKINIVCYLTNKNTLEVENVAFLPYSKASGVNDVVVEQENNAPVEYFNLQGVRVANPSNGIFIRRQGSEVSKVVK